MRFKLEQLHPVVRDCGWTGVDWTGVGFKGSTEHFFFIIWWEDTSRRLWKENSTVTALTKFKNTVTQPKSSKQNDFFLLWRNGTL